jgi:hypothetical protein
MKLDKLLLMIRPFIDAHVHLNTTSLEKMEKAIERDAYFLSINTDIPFFISLDEQKEKVLSLAQLYPHRVKFITSFSVDGWADKGWSEKAINQIAVGLESGAVGVKIWKNIGMELKDDNGDFVMIDHPRFDPLFDFLDRKKILVVGHLGEPKNCWLPLNKMTVDSDRKYFSQHPEYHMHLHPEYPSYVEQMEARDNRLKKHPNLKFIGLHLASLEWSVAEVAKWLDTFPLAQVDLAERVCHLQYQVLQDRAAVRNFMIRYQDRIIYGTDVIDDGQLSPRQIADRFDSFWNFHWEFFATGHVMQAPEFKGMFRGLNLPKAVLDKIFYRNAANIYGFSTSH